MGPFHLLFKKWNKFNHGRPLLMKGYGSWLKIKDPPLDYWCRRTFKAIGEYFGELEEIAKETLNLQNCSKALIRVKRNLCGFIPSTIEIIDVNRGKIFLNFGDIEIMDPRNITKCLYVYQISPTR